MNMIPLIVVYNLILFYGIWLHVKIKNKNSDLLEEQDRIVKAWAQAAVNFRDYRERFSEDEHYMEERLDGCLNDLVSMKYERDLSRKEYNDLVASYKKLKLTCHEQGLQLQRLNEQYTILFNKSQPHDH